MQKVVDAESVGSESVRSESIGLESIRPESIGLESVGSKVESAMLVKQSGIQSGVDSLYN